MIDLNTIWYVLVGVLLVGYAILDGFDLGVGMLSLLARDPGERRIYLNAIGPVWDGNEVWLVTMGGALFAAFPVVYATVFSGFYLALLLLLLALILRAVSFEFRGKIEAAAWRRVWDGAFGFGSLAAALLFGVAFGNILRGIPVNAQGAFAGTFIGLLNPYAVLIGLLSVVLFYMHGAIYMTLKSDGPLQERMRAHALRGWAAFLALYAAATVATIETLPFLFAGIPTKPLFYPVFLTLVAAIAAIRVMLKTQRDVLAFVASAGAIAGMIAMAGISLFPRLVPSSLNPAYSLTIYNASSTPKTLGVMLAVALLGMPLVLVYTAYVYWVFRGKTTITRDSY